MQTNELGFIATILFVFVPTVFLILLYTLTASRESGKNS
ncbi:photosystem II reaction center protein PsbM [Brunnivagina elsteri]|uniref:Photosystem II reaction center protein M n=1 Tax=Brunnivagina elsteri CCALA 953 TaxID=987040 RepID=A0A2A2TDT9_9CYAN|nr:photosystem II reaction center protein PsbM [Calothrix elsteri]NJL62323.1 photosystem II reaction center protein M [Candidatus Methylacidiphilales bacterium]NJR17759.1 photosystem II reaction center protein M [Calothrix sp. CSU_2_0]PAX51795.1 photosystem II reaction center protein M [Calothrix elsteri CCALA 953]